MDYPNITMEEYIRFEEEKDQRHGRMYNWQTATYGKVKYYEDEDDCFTNFETEFPAIVFDDTLTSDAALSCKPLVSHLNRNKIDFRISFHESNDEDYMVIFDNNSFSYKIISVDNLKTDSENDNDKVDMPSFLSPDPTVNSLTEPAVSHHHIDKLDLKNEISLSECDEEEPNIMCFNLFPLNITYPSDLKLDKDNDDDELDIIWYMAPLPPRDQRHPWLRYQVKGYNEDIVHNYEQRLETIFGRGKSCLLAMRGGDCLRPEDAKGAHDERRTRRRTGDASTSVAQQDEQQPDP
ncbi:hypothetical protein Tco_0968322 [Tanacetum coccineum]